MDWLYAAPLACAVLHITEEFFLPGGFAEYLTIPAVNTVRIASDVDMAEAALVTLDGEAKHYFQYRLLSSDQKQPDGSDRVFWFFDPKPVGTADPIGPSLWQPVSELPMDGDEIAAFVQAIQTGAQVPCTGDDGRWSTLLCLAAEESIRQQRELSLPIFTELKS